MGNKVNFIQATDFINLYYTPRGQRNYENKVESRKQCLRIIPIDFYGCISFKMHITLLFLNHL